MEKFKNMQDLLQQTLNKKMYLTGFGTIPEGGIRKVVVTSVRFDDSNLDPFLLISFTLEIDKTVLNYRYDWDLKRMFCHKSLDHVVKLFGYEPSEWFPITKMVDYKTKEVLS